MFDLHFADGIATIAIDRPETRNAIRIVDWLALAERCAEIAASDARTVLLLSADDQIFSAGADISEFPVLQGDAEARTRFREAMRTGIGRFRALPVPTIAVVTGGCYGAAVALALAADIRIAGDAARFATTPAKLGLAYPGEDVARLKATVGGGWAAYMLYSGSVITADQALAIGLVQRREHNPRTAAEDLAGQIAANAPGAVRELKHTLLHGNDETIDARFDARFGSDEFAERLAAFRNRKG